MVLLDKKDYKYNHYDNINSRRDTMTKIPRIADAEWKIMKVVWAAPAPVPAYDIIQLVAPGEDWQPRTVKTLLGRLVKKKALGYRKYKNLYLYFPLVKESDCLKAESESFLARFFDGALQPMLAHFVEHRRLTPSEIKELKKILEP
jgi:BlaI family transcriptional regulator, penicillinase repressor